MQVAGERDRPFCGPQLHEWFVVTSRRFKIKGALLSWFSSFRNPSLLLTKNYIFHKQKRHVFIQNLSYGILILILEMMALSLTKRIAVV